MSPIIDKARLAARLDHMASITVPDRPWERTAFSDLHLQARAWLAREMAAACLQTRLDPAANLIGFRPGIDEGASIIAIGSHSDTVPSGGRYDGIAGVLVALEVAQALHEAGHHLRHSLEVIDFLAEEPNKYGLSCVGSRAMSGLLEPAMLAYKAPDGTVLAEGIAFMGGSPDQLGRARRASGEIAAFLELHIEQARVLEAAGEDIGAVTAIAGIERLDVTVTGRADHAGATPMNLRKDAMTGAAEMVLDIETRARAVTGATLVATVGKLHVFPNAANAVPDQVRFTLEARANDGAALSAFVERARRRCADIAATRGLALDMRSLSRSEPVAMAPALQGLIRDAAGERGYRHRAMFSGAGHDAAYMARLAPTGMIFIPCREGRSHCPEEYASPEQIIAGAQILLDVLLRLDEQNIASTDARKG